MYSSGKRKKGAGLCNSHLGIRRFKENYSAPIQGTS